MRFGCIGKIEWNRKNSNKREYPNPKLEQFANHLYGMSA